MTIANTLNNGFNKIINIGGTILKTQNYSITYDSVYDDISGLTPSGTNHWISGIVFPLKNEQGTKDYILLEQGLINPDDLKLFISGNINLNTGSDILKLQIGSPNGDKYEVLNLNIEDWRVSNESIFKKGYIRKLPTGSFVGE